MIRQPPEQMTDDKSAIRYAVSTCHLSSVICNRNEPQTSFAVYVFALPDKHTTPCWLRTVVARVQIGLSSRTAVTSTLPVITSPR
jgi:hypothetical protein